MERFGPPRPDHVPPENLDDAALADSIGSLRRKRQSVRMSLRTARLAGAALLVVAVAVGFTLLWMGPAPFLARIFQDGAAVTVPELLSWWAAGIAVALFAGAVSTRLFQHRLHVVRGWKHRVQEIEQRLEHAEAEARRRASA